MASAKSVNWKTVGIWALRIVSLLLIAGVLASTTSSNQWWIRAWDFPRVQLIVAMMLLAAALWQYDERWRPWLPLAMLGLLAWQIYRVYPYSPVSPTTVAQIEPDRVEGAECFSVLSLNVLQKNREYGRTLDVIERVDPDILLLMETDQAWVDAMAPVLARYPEVLSRPIDNTYGLLFATRLPASGLQVRDLAQKDTPSVTGTLSLGQQDFWLIGLHPRPPKPNQDTEERDAELIVAAKEARELGIPAIAIGDFNDVAWSDTTELFMQIGQFLDPRMGRGTFATFPADMTWLGWPLDHLFVTDEFLLQEKEVLEHVGSDHRPILARMCLDPARARSLNAEAEDADEEDLEEAEEVMEEFEEDTAKDRVEGEAG